MKHDEKKKRLRKQRSVKPDGPAVEPAPSLCEFWAELQHAKAAGAPLPAAPGAVSSGAAFRSSGNPRSFGSGRSSGSYPSSGSGSGSGGGGYGLALVEPDPESLERIRRIMRALCEQDAKRKR